LTSINARARAPRAETAAPQLCAVNAGDRVRADDANVSTQRWRCARGESVALPRSSQIDDRGGDVDTPSGMAAAPAVAAPALLALVDSTLRELHGDTPGLPAVTLASVLDRDLGFDSLGRTELLLRTERAFGIRLPEGTLQRAETVADLLLAAQQAAPTVGRAAAGADRRMLLRAAPARRADEGTAAEDTPASAETLLDAFEWHLRAHADRTHLTCLDGDVEQPLSYRRLADDSATLAAGLQRAGVQPRQCVAIMLPTSPAYFSSYLGILRAGAVPVPIYPPARASQLEEHVLRHAGILDNARATLLVTVPEAMIVARLLQARVPGLRHVMTPQQLAARGGVPSPVAVLGDDIAFVQYTSGSTGNPKGVALTHANLLANIRAMAQVVQATPRDVFVSWLPLYHDMGLIGAWLGALYVGYALIVMSPLAFLARPERWLQAIGRYRGTLSAAPNFAYELCVKRIDDAASAGLDLSCWRLAFNGAEAVSADTVQRFEQRFARCGLRPGVVTPVYGLAEACLGLLFPPLGRAVQVDRIQREAFEREHRAQPAAAGDATALRFVACGAVLPGHAIRLVGDDGRDVDERIEGRLEFRGPSATHGYFRKPEQTARLIHDGWLDSGDRAYRAAGDVYITGRVKDIVIRGGRNLLPQEIEDSVGNVAGVRKGCVVAFGSSDPATGTERLVVLAETQPGDAAAQAQRREAVSRAVIAAIGEPPDEVVLVPPHSVLKTSSGKLRRSACRTAYEAGRIGAAVPTARTQVMRLALGAVAARLQLAAASIGRALFGLYAGLLFWGLAAPAWLLTVGLRNPGLAWRINHHLARCLLRLTGTPFTVRNLDHLPEGPCVLACTHASYLDGVILIAALPRPFGFVAKGELRKSFAPRLFLQRLGAEFVDRVEAERGVADAARLADAVARGRSLIFFPEGTFAPRHGLLPLHLGAFMTAARARVPLVPVVLRGNREMLPDGRWWPRPAQLEVECCEPVLPDEHGGDTFAAALALRTATQLALARGL
jgi:1-acyl-sn-glycerol-3-phosphate acyltransferase